MFQRIDKGLTEYVLLIARAYNAERKKSCVRFSFQTIEEFHHFRYDIQVDHSKTGQKLYFRLRGIQPKPYSLSEAGRAETFIDVFDLSGSYSVSITKPGKITNQFSLDIQHGNIQVLRPVEGKPVFMEVTSQEL